MSKRPIEDIEAGNAFRNSLIDRADTSWAGAPAWHGWAIMDAFLAGIDHAKKPAPSPSSVDELVGRLEKAAGYLTTPKVTIVGPVQEIELRHALTTRDAAALIRSLAAEREELLEALEAAEKADKIHTKCTECMEYGQSAEACGDCFPSADDARVKRRNVLAKVKKAVPSRRPDEGANA